MNPFDLAQRFTGIQEVAGTVDNPVIVSMLKLDADWPENDEVPWCSAFVNFICWLLRLPRSKSLRARSWLLVGTHVELEHARKGDIVVLQRGPDPQPGIDVIEAPGHVGFFASYRGNRVEVLGGNQSNTVKVSSYPATQVLSVRRI